MHSVCILRYFDRKIHRFVRGCAEELWNALHRTVQVRVEQYSTVMHVHRAFKKRATCTDVTALHGCSGAGLGAFWRKKVLPEVPLAMTVTLLAVLVRGHGERVGWE